MSLTWSFTVNVRFAKLLRNLSEVNTPPWMCRDFDLRSEILGYRFRTLQLHLVQELLEVEWRWFLVLPLP